MPFASYFQFDTTHMTRARNCPTSFIELIKCIVIGGFIPESRSVCRFRK